MLRERLQARRPEIEAAALTRVSAISDPAEVADPAYAEGLRTAIAAAIAYGIETTGREGGEPPIPVALLAQARIAARAGIPLDTVLRRYFAGYSLLGYFVLEEAANAGIGDGAELKRLLGAHAGLFDRLLAAVGEEHGREAEGLALATGERRHAERIERILAGEPINTSDIPYAFEGWHLGVVASGHGAKQAIHALADPGDYRLLRLPREGELLWGWLGAYSEIDALEFNRIATAPVPDGVSLALGEPAQGLAGWRVTHRQAVAALPVALRGCESPVCYRDVALLASALQDDLLAASLRRLYLEPLDGERDGGVVLRKTLRAYLEASGSLSSAAAMLGVSRRTVGNRLRRVEETIGRPLQTTLVEIEMALRLDGLGTAPPTSRIGRSAGG